MENSIIVDFAALDRMAAKLDRAGNELNTAMSLLSGAQLSAAAGAQMRLNGGAIALRTAGVTVSAANVAQAVQNYRTALGRVGGYAGDLSAGVRAAANAFRTAESTLAGSPLPTQPDGGERSDGDGGSESSAFSSQSWLKWDDLWKFVSEAGFGGAIIGTIGQQLTGGNTAWQKRVLQVLSGAAKAGRGIAKGFTETGFDWKRLFGTNVDVEEKLSFGGAIDKELSKYSFKNAETVGDKIAVGCKWAGTVLTVLTTGWDNYEEAGGQFTGRMVGETVIESGVKIVAGIGAGALATMLLPVGAPAVIVGVTTVGITWAVDKVCEWATGGKNLAETISDGVMDFAESAKDHLEKAGRSIGDAVSSAGKAISGWWNGLFRQPATATATAGGGGGGGAW